MVENIIGIPISLEEKLWISSTPKPHEQLSQLRDMGFNIDFEDYKKESFLEKIITNKRVAYVCPSPHLKGMKMGSYIDSFDYVIRVNQNFEMPEDTWEDYGKRTDILVSCLNINKLSSLRENPDFIRSLKYILCPMVSMWDVGRVDKFLKDSNIPHQNVSDGYLFKVFKEVGTTCNTGLMGIITLLNYNIKELYVTGMTFFNMNNFGKVYYDHYHDVASRYNNFSFTKEREPSIADLRIDIHNQTMQIEYFKKIVKYKYKNPLELDSFLIENFIKG